MEKVVVIIGAEHPLAGQLIQVWLSEGWRVYAALDEHNDADSSKHFLASLHHAEKLHVTTINSRSIDSMKLLAEKITELSGKVDLLVHCIDRRNEAVPLQALSSSDVMDHYELNTLSALRAVEIMLPLMSNGLKRICFLSNTKGSITKREGGAHIGYNMSLTAKHMSVKIMSNALSDEGYRFKIMALSDERSASEHSDELAQQICKWFVERECGETFELVDEQLTKLPY